jgi:hypothetical protein
MKIILSILATTLALGCAHTTIKKITKDDKTDGVRYFMPHPYLWVTYDTKGNHLKTEIIMLPDSTEEYVVEPTSGLGSAVLSLNLENGWNLTQFNNNEDSKIPDTITGLASLASGIVGLQGASGTSGFMALHGKNESEKIDPLLPGLYRIDLNSPTPLVTIFQFKTK